MLCGADVAAVPRPILSNREVIFIDTEICLEAITCTGGMWMKQGSAGCEFGDVTEMNLFQFKCD